MFDEHGRKGTEVAQHLRCKMSQAVVGSNIDRLPSSDHLAAVYSQLSQSLRDKVDTNDSGSTGISVLVDHDSLFIANLGDSRAVIGCEVDGKLEAFDLSIDQTPYREDERERIMQCGGRIRSIAQMFGEVPMEWNCWEHDEDGAEPPRVYSNPWPHPQHKFGGCAFTRSFGDSYQQEFCGVIDEPEIIERRLTSADKHVILASDVVFEFLPSQVCVEVLDQHDGLLNGLHASVSR